MRPTQRKWTVRCTDDPQSHPGFRTIKVFLNAMFVSKYSLPVSTIRGCERDWAFTGTTDDDWSHMCACSFLSIQRLPSMDTNELFRTGKCVNVLYLTKFCVGTMKLSIPVFCQFESISVAPGDWSVRPEQEAAICIPRYISAMYFDCKEENAEWKQRKISYCLK